LARNRPHTLVWRIFLSIAFVARCNHPRHGRMVLIDV
jgi:hypothetical protein